MSTRKGGWQQSDGTWVAEGRSRERSWRHLKHPAKKDRGRWKGGEASLASETGPKHSGTGRGMQGPAGSGRDRTQEPLVGTGAGRQVLTVHRGEGVCFAVHIHGEAEEREQRGRRRRVASQTQLQDLRRKGRDGGGGRVSGRRAAAGRAGAESWGGSRAALPAGAGHRSGRNFPPSGRRGWAVSRAAPGRWVGPGGPGDAWLARAAAAAAGGLKPGGAGDSLSSLGTRSSESRRSERGRGEGGGPKALRGERGRSKCGELAKLAEK